MGFMERKSGTDVLDKPDLPAELKKMQTDITSALDQLMKSVDAKNADTIRNLTDHISKYNDHAEKYAADKKAFDERAKAAEKKAEDAEKRVKDLETAIATKGVGGKADPYAEPEVKSFYDWMRSRPKTAELTKSSAEVERHMLERKDMLRTDNMTAGGYLVPPVTDGRIREKVIELSPVRQYATGTPLGTKSMSVAIEKAIPDSYFEGETEAAIEGEPQFGEETVTAWRQAVKVKMTYDQLIMSPFPMESRITSSVGKSFAKKESWMLLKGSGSKQPQGCLMHPDTTKQISAASQIVTFDDIANLIGSLKTGYNPMLCFNRLTFAQLIQLKDNYGRPLWQPVAGDKPATIWDQPYSSKFIDMDSMYPATYSAGALTRNATSNTIPIMYADLAAAYEIFDVQGISVIRDDVTAADQSIIIYNFRRWLTAKTIMPEAIKLLKVQ